MGAQRKERCARMVYFTHQGAGIFPFSGRFSAEAVRGGKKSATSCRPYFTPEAKALQERLEGKTGKEYNEFIRQTCFAFSAAGQYGRSGTGANGADGPEVLPRMGGDRKEGNAMDENGQIILGKRIAETMENLRRNRMQPYFVTSRTEVVPKVQELLREGDTVAAGGSMTLEETGVLAHLRSGRYRFLDRGKPGLSPEEIRAVYTGAFSADAYLLSANAITQNGELYNVDGNSNRVAALLYGPKSVIVVAGYNKIVRDLDAAVNRVKFTAAPANCVRLDRNTYCLHKGRCASMEHSGACMSDGCRNDDRICCSYVVSAFQREAGRIKVILVGEELGY